MGKNTRVWFFEPVEDSVDRWQYGKDFFAEGSTDHALPPVYQRVVRTQGVDHNFTEQRNLGTVAGATR